MLGLITKDLICMKKYAIKILLIMGLYLIIFASSGNLVILSSIIIMFSTMLISATFSYDELAKWDCFGLSLPVTKKQIVLSKYLLSLIFDVMGMLIVLVIHVIKNQLEFEELMSIYALGAAALILSSILLPLIYKFGTQKSRLWMILIFLLPTAVAILIKQLGFDFSLGTPNNYIIEMIIKISLPAALIIYVLSYFISCHIFENKEI